MADTNTKPTLEKFINHDDLKGITDVEDIKEYVNAPSREPLFWDSLCDHDKWNPAYSAIVYRELDISDLTVDQAKATEMKEAIAPDPSKIKYKSYKATTKDFGLRFPYTEVELRNNYHGLKRDIGRTLRYQADDVTENLKAAQFIKSRYTLTLGEGDRKWRDLFIKAKSVLMKNKGKGSFKAIMTTEALAELRKELETAGETLPESVKSDINKNGAITHYNGFDIIERTDAALYESGSQYVIFLAGHNVLGNMAVKAFGGVQWDVIDNPLGSGVIADKNGNIVSDYNHQMGAVAANLKNFGAVHQADEIHLVCKVTLAEFGATDGGEQTYEFGATGNGSAESPKA